MIGRFSVNKHGGTTNYLRFCILHISRSEGSYLQIANSLAYRKNNFSTGQRNSDKIKDFPKVRMISLL